jgi:hypothetical protein
VGLVDVLITDADPDYQWVDTFRTSRGSNEASQRVLQQLSCRLRREMGRKVLEMGGNVVFAFRETFDVEEYTRTFTVRGLGTAALVFDPAEGEPSSLNSPGSPTGSIDILTLSALPSGCITAIGGVVSARAIKLISEEMQERGPGDENVREGWLNELRDDIRSHARLLGCNSVMNYGEEVRIQDDIYLLSAEATACKIDFAALLPVLRPPAASMLAGHGDGQSAADAAEQSHDDDAPLPSKMHRRRPCCASHVSYRRQRAPFPVELSLCRLCQRRYVPDLILATIEPPVELETAGETGLVEAFVFKPVKRKRDNELTASAISSAMPFVEYDLHRQLLYKLRLRGYNAIFGLRYSIAVSASAIVAVASGTAVLVLSLPPPEPLQISRDLEVRDEEDRWVVETQRKILAMAEDNHRRVERLLESFPHLLVESGSEAESDDQSDASDSESSSGTSRSSSSSADSRRHAMSIVQIDDETDEDLVLVLLEPEFGSHPHDFLVGNLEGPPALSLHDTHGTAQRPSKIVPQLVTVFKRVRINLDGRHLPFQLARVFHSIYREAWAKALLSFEPTPSLVLRSVKHHVYLTKESEVQITMTAVVFGEMAQPSAAEEEDRQEREEEWEELISLDVSSSSSDDSDEEEQHRLFSRRRRRSLEDDGDDGSDASDDGGEAETHRHDPDDGAIRNTITSPGGKIQKFIIAGHMNHVDLTTAATIPASVTVHNLGSISLKLLKEVHLNEVPGGSAATFTLDFLLEAYAILRAHVIALGGNALTNLAVRPAAFLENFKNQLHGVLLLSGDVLEVELDEPDAWSMLSHKAFYPSASVRSPPIQ